MKLKKKKKIDDDDDDYTTRPTKRVISWFRFKRENNTNQ